MGLINPESDESRLDECVHAGIRKAFGGHSVTTDVFEEMLRRSIPQYDVMRKAVFEIATRSAQIPALQAGCHDAQ